MFKMNILGPLKEIGIGMACSSCLNIQCVGQPYHRLRASRRCRTRMGTFSSAAKLMACEQHRLGCPKSPKSPTIPSGASKLMGLARTSILTAFAAILGVTASTRADTLDTASPSSLLSTDGVIGIAFTVAVLALGALTLGVLYLTISSWLDNRAEKAERDKFEKAFRERGTSATREEGDRMAVQKKRKARDYVSKGGGKGFGK